LGRVDQAVIHLESALRLDPADRESRSLLALLRAAAPQGEDVSGLGRILADDTFATVAFGAVCLEQGCVEEAAQIFTRILRKDPDNREARAGLETTLRARQRRKGYAAMLVSTAEFKKGLRIVFDGEPYTIVDFPHVKPGKGGAFIRTKLKHMRSGKVIDNTFRQ